MKFHYKAQSKLGTLIEDTIDAPDKDAVIDMLREKGATPISIEAPKKKKGEISIPFIDNLIGGVGLQDKIVFSKNLARMLSAGLSLSRALEVMQKQTKKKIFRDVLAGLSKEISEGGTLSSGLKKYPKVFSPLFIAMVHAGEESGAISENLLEISAQLDKTYKLRKKVKGAMIYPGVILTAMIIIGVLMFIFVVPTLLQTFKDFELDLPASTKAIIFVSDFLQNNTLLFVVSLFGSIGGLVALLRMKSMKKPIDIVSLKIPAVGKIVKEMNAALITRTLSSLLSSGLAVTQALSITKEVTQNVLYKESMDEAIKNIERGDTLSKMFKDNTEIYPISIGEMLAVGEETGKSVDMLSDVATFFEEEVDNKTKNLSTIIEPVLMLIIGAAVGFFAVSMMSPMYSLLDGIT